MKENSNKTNHEFKIPIDECGTAHHDNDVKALIEREEGTSINSGRSFENVIIFQNDPTYQEVWDAARLIICRYAPFTNGPIEEKRLIFKPFVVDMLDIVTVSLYKIFPR